MSKSSIQLSGSSMSIPRSIPEIIRRCVALADRHRENEFGIRESEIRQQFVRVLELLWGVWAQLAAETLPKELNVRTDNEHPGYLFVSQDDSSYAVPFFLIDLFPGGQLLAELKELSNRVRVSKGSVICLSGSGCTLGLGIPVADIDFCEYLSAIDSSVTEGLISATRLSSKKFVCREITVNPKKRWSRPWMADLSRPTTTFVERTTKLLRNSSNRKVDYVANTEFLGVLEVTNKLLTIDFAYGEVGEAKSSFALQEVPFDAPSWVPRRLSDPLEVGRYVTWLMGASREKLCESSETPRFAVKALRRALPLARILMAREEGDELRRLLADENGARLAALHDRCQLFSLLSLSADPDLDVFKTGLKHSIQQLRKIRAHEMDSFDSLTQDECTQLDDFSIAARPVIHRILDSLDGKIAFA